MGGSQATDTKPSSALSEKKELLFSFLRVFVPASLLIAAIFHAFSIQTEKYELQTILIREESALHSAGELTSLLFEQKLSDLLVLAEGETLRNHLHDGNMQNWVRLAREFSLFARRKPKYSQIRYIDSRGKEVIRINNADGEVEIVPKSGLQNKSSRYYFQEAIALEQGEIYISPLDLNVEHGVIEQPIKPTIRFATPVFDGYGEKRGILVINYTPSELLQRIADIFKSVLGEAVMLNQDGYWLMGAPQEQLWGFMYGKDMTFAKQRPDVWTAISASESGRFSSDEGVFIFQKAYPLNRAGLGTLENITPNPTVADRFEGDRYWIYLSHISKALIDQLTAKRAFISTVTYGLLFVVTGFISAFFARNAVQKKQALRKLREHAVTDELTGVANRRELQTIGEKEFKRARRFSRSLCVMMLDLDHFKRINDNFGHAVGDQVLKQIAGICQGHIRGQDLLTRYGGEEFVILLPETDSEGARQLAERICYDVSIQPFEAAPGTIKMTVSIGLSEMAASDADYTDIIQRADAAMYTAKKLGRNQVVVN